jgi:NAD-specific glutamate dehydrogenase
MAGRFASLPYLCPASEVAAAAGRAAIDVLAAGKVYFALDASLQLGELRQLLRRAGGRNRWDRLAIEGLHDDLVEEHRRLTLQALGDEALRGQIGLPAEALAEAVGAWLAERVPGLARWRRLLAEIESQPSPDLAMLAVVVRTLSGLNATEAAAA